MQFIYWTDNSCNLASKIIEAVAKSIALLRVSYDEDKRPKRPPVSMNPFTILIEGWQQGKATGENLTGAPVGNESNSSAYNQRMQSRNQKPWYIRLPINLVEDVTGITEIPLIGLALELPKAVTRIFRCDVEAVMFCTGHHYSVFTSAAIATIILTLVGLVFSFTGIPIVATLLSLIAFTSIVMFISFDYAPACVPLIPTCFFESMIDDVVRFIPTRIIIPQSLLSCRWDQATDGPPPAKCIVSCGESPYEFNDWTSNVAWVLCNYYPESCKQAQLYIAKPGNGFSLILGPDATNTMESALYRSRLISTSGNQNMREGYAWCNALSFYNVLPLLGLVALLVISVPLLIGMMMRVFVGVLRTVFSAYAMSHS